MNLKDYQAGRERGLRMALDIVTKEGVQGLSKHVNMMARTGINPPKIGKDWDEQVMRVRQLIQEGYTILIIETLHTELGFGSKRASKFINRLNLKAECIVDDMVSWQDYVDAIKEELKLEADLPVMESVGLVKAREKRESKRQRNARLSTAKE